MFKQFTKRVEAGPEYLSFLAEDNEPEAKPQSRQNPGGKLETLNEVISFLKTRRGQKTSCYQIGKAINKTDAYASVLVNELIAKGSISRHGKRGSHKYTVHHNRVNGKRKAKAPKQRPSKTPTAVSLPKAVPATSVHQLDSTQLVHTVDALAWDFIKETGNTSVVAFLAWLNAKNK